MESDGTCALREARRGFVRLHRCEGVAVSYPHETTDHQRRDADCRHGSTSWPAAYSRERHRRTSQGYRLRREGRLRNSDDERGADGNREEWVAEWLSCRRCGGAFV